MTCISCGWKPSFILLWQNTVHQCAAAQTWGGRRAVGLKHFFHAEIISSFITPLRPKYPKKSFGFIKYQEQRGAAVDQWLRVKCPLSVRSRVRLQSPEGATLKGQSLCSSPAKMSEENRRRRSIQHENLCQIKSNVDYLLRWPLEEEAAKTDSFIKRMYRECLAVQKKKKKLPPTRYRNTK